MPRAGDPPPSRPAPAGARSRRPRLTLTSDLPTLAIQHENLEDKIYRQLRDLIVERRILPGDRVPVDALASRMGVSRTPLVNALKRLAQEGVVEWLSRRGVYVRRFTKRQMARLFEVREALEGLAARLAAPRIPRPEVDRLRALWRSARATDVTTAVRQYVQLDRYFHGRLVEIAGNAHLAQAMNSVNMMFFAYQDGLVRSPAETAPEHRAILAALRRQDPEASEAAMRFHIRRSVERLEREAEAEDAEGPPAGGRETRPRGRAGRSTPVGRP